MSPSPPTGFQPLLHGLVTCLAAPTVTLSDRDGQLRPTGAQGMFSADLRALARAEFWATEPGGGPALPMESVSGQQRGADRAEFLAVLRTLGTPGPDPTVWVRRTRQVSTNAMSERFRVENVSPYEVSVDLRLALGTDMADMEVVKSGQAASAATAGGPVDTRLTDEPDGVEIGFAAHEIEVRVRAVGADAQESGPDQLVLGWSLVIPARSVGEVSWDVAVLDHGAAVVAPRWARPAAAVTLRSADDRLTGLVSRSLADLAALRMATAARPDDEFYAAGSPWYFTLFGRDSIWAARMTLPLGLSVARGTLRTLAHWQGRRVDPTTAEEPGKIMHELRRPNSSLPDPFLPPTYYGTVDATPLWICLLFDAWRWGLPRAEVTELLPALEAALDWMPAYGDSDGDGFLEYIDVSGRGLANQGWKDSGDSIRFADGRIADGPVALCEVQGYAYQAAVAGARLLDEFGRPGAQRWRDYAAALQARFREKFWLTDDLGRYPALALDGTKQPVDAPASNIGHLLATGILEAGECAEAAARLTHPSLASGFGLRTMADNTGGYSPLSYHCGSVWPHDTAIAVSGLVTAGRPEAATGLLNGLLDAGAAFDFRLPELYGGWSSAEFAAPVPYPASCRPQAWSAAAAVALLTALLGLEVNVPAGTARIAPMPGCRDLEVSGLELAGSPLTITVTDGKVRVDHAGPIRFELPT